MFSVVLVFFFFFQLFFLVLIAIGRKWQTLTYHNRWQGCYVCASCWKCNILIQPDHAIDPRNDNRALLCYLDISCQEVYCTSQAVSLTLENICYRCRSSLVANEFCGFVHLDSLDIRSRKNYLRNIYLHICYVQVSTSCWGNDSIHHIWPVTCGVFYHFLQLKLNSFPFTRVFLTYFILQIAKGLKCKTVIKMFLNVESCPEVSVEV